MEIEIIAEAAQGFEGNIIKSELLIRAAAAAGADAIKFQMVFSNELATPDYKYYELFKELEMTYEQWRKLADIAKECNIRLYADIFGSKSLSLALKLDIQCVKIHGTDIANISLLEDVNASPVKHILLGAGGAYSNEIKLAVEVLSDKQITILLGFQSYPTETQNNQIARIKLLQNTFKNNPQVTLGFADHADPQTNEAIALAATAIGAGVSVIEKHITLSRNLKMEDYESALNPDEFELFSSAIRKSALAIGSSNDANDFGMSEQEKSYRKMIRRHVVAKADIPKGAILTPSHLVLKRTSVSEPITDLTDVYNKIAITAISENAAITRNNID
jgi:N,N'-diacetyllegionaminate synthase